MQNTLQGHTNFDTAYEVDDYPYGFRLRTKIRYWVEGNKNGDRFVSCTLNPKNGKWNKPKADTYKTAGVLFIEETTGHVKYACINPYHSVEQYEAFIAEYELTEGQKKYLAVLIKGKRLIDAAYQKAFQQHGITA